MKEDQTNLILTMEHPQLHIWASYAQSSAHNSCDVAAAVDMRMTMLGIWRPANLSLEDLVKARRRKCLLFLLLHLSLLGGICQVAWAAWTIRKCVLPLGDDMAGCLLHLQYCIRCPRPTASISSQPNLCLSPNAAVPGTRRHQQQAQWNLLASADIWAVVHPAQLWLAHHDT